VANNVEFAFVVAGLTATGQLGELYGEIGRVLDGHGIRENVSIAGSEDGSGAGIVGRPTRDPIAVNGESEPWVQQVADDLAAAVREVAPAALVEVRHAYPDLDGQALLWPVATTQQVGEGVWRRLAYDPTGRVLFGAHSDGRLRAWDTTTGGLRFTAGAHRDGATVVTVSPDGRRVATGGGDGRVRIWDVDTGSRIRDAGQEVTRHDVTRLVFHPDNRRIIGGYDRTIQVWDPDSGRTRRLAARDRVTGLACHPAGTLVAANAGRRTIIWDAETGREVHTIRHDTTGQFDVAFSPDGSTLIIAVVGHGQGGPSGRLLCWDADGHTPKGELLDVGKSVHDVTLSADGAVLAALTIGKVAGRGWRTSARSWSMPEEPTLPDGRLRRPQDRCSLTDDLGIHGMALAPDGQHIATGNKQDSRVTIWDTTTGAAVRTLDAPASSA
jgi:WD40 repeat protein